MLFLKDQLYYLHKEEGDDSMVHLNIFNWWINDLLRVEAKYEGNDKFFLLLQSFLILEAFQDYTHVR